MVNVTVDWDGLGPTAKKVRNASILKSSLQRMACWIELKTHSGKQVILLVLNEPVKTNMQYVAGSQPPSQGFSLFLSRMLETVRYVNYSQFD